MRNPNKPLPGASHPDPEPRHRGPPGRGDAAHDGYTLIGRRPHVAMRGFEEPVTVAEAERIEASSGTCGRCPGSPTDDPGGRKP